MRVLLIEDDASLQRATSRLIRRTFSPTEIVIDIVDAPKGAIALLETNRYDFVLSDFNINGGTGGEVLIWIDKYQPYMNERFVFFSGANHLDRWHDKIIAKGIDSTEFVEQLRNYVPMVTS